jgi:Family of unknown function (DUF6335)
MAKRKAVRASGRKRAAKRRGGSRPRAAAKKTAASRTVARKAAKKTARKATAGARTTARAAVKRVKPRKPSVLAKKKTSTARPSTPMRVRTKAKAKAPSRSRTSSAAPPARRATPKAVRPPARTAPGLNRERRTISDDERVPSPPSSLDLNRTASSARSGRRELLEKYEEHTETGPALTGGDVDADWESAYSVGDEAPGGDNPTPDQDIVDDIGRAVGVQYQDNEELKGEKKILERDKHRWELDPASSDDWEDR